MNTCGIGRTIGVGLLAAWLAFMTAAVHAQVIDGVTSNYGGGNYFVGGFGGANGALIVTNAGMLAVTAGSGYVGYGASSTNNSAVITGTGSVWTNSGSMNIGATAGSSWNRLTIVDGGTVYGSGGSVGSGNSNMALVTGPGSVWRALSAGIGTGAGGKDNQLIIADGGKVYSAGGGTSIGTSAGADGNALRVTGDGSMWTNSGNFMVGWSGSRNRLMIEGSGQAFTATDCYIGYGSGNSNTVYVSGSGSVWNMGAGLYVNFGAGVVGNGLVMSTGGVTAVKGAVSIKANGYVTNLVSAFSGGLAMSGSSLTLDGKMNIVFEGAPTQIGHYWGLRWSGNRTNALQGHVDSGRLTFADGPDLPAIWQGKASNYWDGAYTYIGFYVESIPGPPRGTLFLFR